MPHAGAEDVLPHLKWTVVIRVDRAEYKNGNWHVRRHVDTELGEFVSRGESGSALLRAGCQLLTCALRVEIVTELWHGARVEQFRQSAQGADVNAVEGQSDCSLASHEGAATDDDFVVQLHAEQCCNFCIST
ncbi:hypothetical protein AMK17_37795 [Streptomyces sp. CB00072]|nr:hypothetical protein AMK17_37795 [Streptomyces sp. CB00072]